MTPTPESLRLTAAAMEAHAQGKPVQFRDHGDRDWMDIRKPQFAIAHSEYRPAPEPTTRPWSKPADCPPFFWIRGVMKKGGEYLPTSIWPDGISVTFKGDGYFYCWATIAKWEYSTDRRVWLPCTVTEEAK